MLAILFITISLFFPIAVCHGTNTFETDCVNLLSESSNELVIAFTSSSAQLSTVNVDNHNFITVSLPNEGRVGKIGYPDLPSVTRVVIVPPDCEIKIDLFHDNIIEIDAVHLPRPFTVNTDEQNELSVVQMTDALFPEEMFRIGNFQQFRGIRLVPITFYPYQYDCTNQRLIHHEDVEVAVRFERSKECEEGNTTPRLTRDTYRFLNALTLNPPRRDDNGAQLPRGGYLIITGSGFGEDDVGDDVNRLADWKRACGHHVEIAYEQNNANTIMNDLIRPAYEEWDPPLEFVCLIGAYRNPPSPAMNYNDVCYGLLEGRDHISEVAIGRLSAGYETQVRVVINRALGYQANPWTENMDWFGRAGAAELGVRGWTESVDYTIKWIAEAERRAGFSNALTFLSHGQNHDGSVYQWIRDRINTIFTRGCYIDNNFPARTVYPMYISVGGGHTERVWQQMWDQGSPNQLQGPSVMTGTRHRQATLACNVLVGGMARGLLVERLPVGWARAFAMTMLDYAGVGVEGYDYYAAEFSMYGEPGQLTWLGVPCDRVVNHPDALTPGQNRIEVYVEDPEQEIAISNAFVTLTQPGELLVWGTTDDDGLCVLPIDPELEESVILTVTSDDILPYQHEIEIEPEQLFVSAYVSEIIDEEGGNGDGVVNPGETVGLLIHADNLGNELIARNVTGIVSAVSPWVNMEEQVLHFDDIDPQEDSEADELLIIMLLPSAIETDDLGLIITMYCGEESWESSLPVEVEGAHLELVELVGGDVFEPEMNELNIRLENTGGISSPAMIARLDAGSHWIQVIDGLSEYSEIESGEESDLNDEPFIINPSPLAVPGIRVPMTLLLSVDEDDIPDTVHFEIQIDTPHEAAPQGPDEYGYICFDDTDDGWEQAPVYNWIEINRFDNDRDFDGILLPGGRGSDFAHEFELPFTFRYYGEDFDVITICENGFIAMGEGLEELVQGDNFPLDHSMSGSFGMIAPFWDNLIVSRDGQGIYTYFDDEENILIIEWSNASLAYNNQRDITFEIILFDPEFYPVVSGDGNILFQYNHLANSLRGQPPNYFSVGICSPDCRTGINYVSDDDYPVTSAPIQRRRTILFTTAPECEQAYLFGTVIDFENDEPIEEAIVVTSYGQVAITDTLGNWNIPDAWALPFSITAQKQGYNDSTLAGFELDEDDSLEINFALLHPEFNVSTLRLTTMLDWDHQTEMHFTLQNRGNGPLDWSIERRLLGDANTEPWELRRSYTIGDVVDDSRIQGVVFANDHFYVSGANDENPVIYVLDRDGAVTDTIAQPVEQHSRGMRDLAFDGNLIWGAVGNMVYGITTEGEIVHQWRAKYDPTTAIAWDPEHEFIWLSSTTSDPVAYTTEGDWIDTLDIDRQYMRIYGLAYWYDDPDNHPLYIFHRDRDSNLQTVHKVNIETGDTLRVSFLEPEDGGTPEGAFITNQFDIYSWVMMVISNNAPINGGDRIDIWQVDARKDWFLLDIVENEEPIEAIAGRIETGEEREFILNLDATGLPDTLFQGELLFSHNADSGYRSILVDMDVIGPMQPNEFDLVFPANGDTLDSTTVRFVWNPSIDPNADDTLTYTAWIQVGIDSASFDFTDTTFTVIIDSLGLDFEIAMPFTWWVYAVSDPDTIPCNERFAFHLRPNYLNDGLDDIPVEFCLQSIHPNPFNTMTTVTFGVDRIERTKLYAFDITGREVARLFDSVAEVGYHRVVWNAVELPSGVYLLQLESAGRVKIAKTALLK